ncbi:FAD-dependent oxidoreductase [Actinomadura sp. NBRC 104412]|uniref:NAD(P)/FAD-dependent oxidoreductase n=1 Tax=Actinomadura sp. NBRC 104412 TaxID=3032203 RepID=UPI0024A5CFDA|nr:FAD-dependent oxidoreductase [Actinomadura sp. NBRC 104412]GLZ03213.1 FAD-dependent oxidoreductase [Actinomadura sp. NBRC 104412]
MRATRIVVLGAGIIGAACARELALAGCEVIVVDRGGPAAATTAHGEGNVLVSDKGPGPELELARLSRRLWPEVLAEGGRPAEWEPKGGIVVATTEAGAEDLRGFAASQREAGVRAEPLSAAELAAAEPHLARDVTAAFAYPEDAQVQPSGAASVLLGAALRAGAVLRTGCEVLGPVSRGGRITGVRTTLGLIEGDAFVNAAGPWAGELSARLGAPVDVRPRRGEVLVTAPMPPTVFHKVYDADYVGAVGSGSGDLQTSAVVESTRAGTILLGSSRRRVGFDDRLHPGVLSRIAAKALRLFPCLSGAAVMRAYGGFRPYVPDHLPLIGPDPRLSGLWHATGHEGAGIGLSVGTARLLADGLLSREPEMDITPFRVDRPLALAEPGSPPAAGRAVPGGEQP